MLSPNDLKQLENEYYHKVILRDCSSDKPCVWTRENCENCPYRKNKKKKIERVK